MYFNFDSLEQELQHIPTTALTRDQIEEIDKVSKQDAAFWRLRERQQSQARAAYREMYGVS